MRVDARVEQAGSLARAARLEIAAVVLHEDRVVIAGHQPLRPQQTSQAIAPRFVLAVGDDLARLGHHEAGAIRVCDCVASRIHHEPPWSIVAERTRSAGRHDVPYGTYQIHTRSVERREL